MKRKAIIILLFLSLAAVSTIAVCGERYANQIAYLDGTSAVLPLSRFVASSYLVFSNFVRTLDEGSYLVVEGSVFLVLGFLWLRRARSVARTLSVTPTGPASQRLETGP